MSQDSLESILHAAAAGDDQAFAELHERFAGFVRKQIAPHVQYRSELIDEVSQEVWQAVHRQLADYDPARATFSRWVTVIAVRKAITQYKRQTVQAATLERLQNNERGSGAADERPTRRFENDEIIAAVRTCTERLEGRQREVFLLARIEQMAIERIAAFCGITAGRVRGALSEAQRKIVECLQRSGILSADE